MKSNDPKEWDMLDAVEAWNDIKIIESTGIWHNGIVPEWAVFLGEKYDVATGHSVIRYEALRAIAKLALQEIGLIT